MLRCRALPALLIAVLACAVSANSAPVRAQLMDDWLARANATPDAFMTGSAAVFRNPSMIAPRQRGEGVILDLHGPRVSGVSGTAIAGSYRLDARTSVAAGFEHIGVDGIELTQDSPDDGTSVSVGQDLFAVGASHALSRVAVGANVQYLRASSVFNQPSALRLGVGAQYKLPSAIPLTIAANAQSQDNNTSWAAGARVSPSLPLKDWNLYATYGASGSDQRRGIAHRLTAEGVWRDVVSLQVGAVSEAASEERNVTAIGSIGVRVNRYELGVVREALPNGFGGVNTFRIGVLF